MDFATLVATTGCHDASELYENVFIDCRIYHEYIIMFQSGLLLASVASSRSTIPRIQNSLVRVNTTPCTRPAAAITHCNISLKYLLSISGLAWQHSSLARSDHNASTARPCCVAYRLQNADRYSLKHFITLMYPPNSNEYTL